jgi:predicted Rossmann-fold nucleotide-binding protein
LRRTGTDPDAPGSREPRAALSYRNGGFVESDDARPLRILAEYLQPLYRFRQQEIQDTVVFFGSSRTNAESPLGRYYREARELARLLTAWSNTVTGHRRFVVCSGGGSGIMEAANRGARDAGGRTIGLNIGLPHEPGARRRAGPDLGCEPSIFHRDAR